jgi:hypothetical protein
MGYFFVHFFDIIKRNLETGSNTWMGCVSRVARMGEMNVYSIFGSKTWREEAIWKT